jgi:methionyl-tRNA formyltransferase
MKIAVFTQDERIFLPSAVGTFVEAMPEKIGCIVLSPPMSTHGGFVRGFLKHLAVFGLKGTIVMGSRVLLAHVGPRLGIRPSHGTYAAIEEIGDAFSIPTFHVANVNSPEMETVLDEHPCDLLVSISCPQIVRPKLLRRFPSGGINVHSAPLPKYRGLMPGFWVLLNGEKETAVTVHDLAEKLDNGDILLQRRIAIDVGETWDSLIRKTKRAAGEALIDAVSRIEAGNATRTPNRDEESTYFSFPTWKDARAFRARGHRMF